MIQTTYIIRVSDGLTLCEQSDTDTKVPVEIKQKIKQLIKTGTLRQEVEDLKCYEVDQSHQLCFKRAEGVAYLVLTDKNYPVKLSKIYLDEIRNGFVEELKSTYGTQSVDYQSKIETIEEPYKFLKFDRFIKKKKFDYQDVRSSTNIERLKSDITSIHNMMVENIDLIMDRDKTLHSMGSKASNLKEASKAYQNKTQTLKTQLWLKKYIIVFVLVALFGAVILFKLLL